MASNPLTHHRLPSYHSIDGLDINNQQPPYQYQPLPPYSEATRTPRCGCNWKSMLYTSAMSLLAAGVCYGIYYLNRTNIQGD